MKGNRSWSGASWFLIGFLAILEGCIGLLDPNDHNKGIISAVYPQTVIPSDKWSCYEPALIFNPKIGQANIVIDNDSSFHGYFDYKNYYDSTRFSGNFPCINYQLEPIDFSKYTLLGNYAAGGCNVAFTRIVEPDDRAKKYIYTVDVREAGACKKLEYSMNWILVPKLPVGYTVEFLVK
ncbi:hypothetical protein [Spirosoma endophyticum]|uniref:Uncharacterized protein n=1 Tax=Spirosoma endophyticum TaxID=662367 RepID=A0A1I1PZQ6_9BACT|nr:hypothetical protein [Spirosoma endophyticum]SFD15309.1 hypothetical protein SAMN05216167_103533 [Spirosoma endophyticum]